MNAHGDQLDEKPTTAPYAASSQPPPPEILTIGRPAKTSDDKHQPGAHRAASQPSSPHTGPGAGALKHLAPAFVTMAVIALAGTLTTSRAASPDSTPDPSQADIQQLRQLTRTENQALVDADADRLTPLLAADFTMITPDGEPMSGKQLIAALGSGDLDYWSIRVVELSTADPIEVHVDGPTATVSYESDIEVGSHPISYHHDATGADYHHLLRTRHTDTWTKTASTWQHLHTRTTATTTEACR